MSLDVWKRKRTPLKAKLTRFKNQFEAYDKASGLGTWAIQLAKFEPVYDEFDQTQREIEMLTLPENEHVESRERSEFENAYFEIVSCVTEFIEQTRSSNLTASTSGRVTIPSHEQQSQPSSITELANLLSANALISNLPSLKLPTFDGSYKEWVKFRDSYKTMVHDQSGLSNIQKFHYLNSALTGDAARVIQSLGVSDANYTLAWQGLLDRYEDSRSIVHFHVKALFDLPVITKVTFSALRQLIDDANNHLHALKSLGEETEGWDTLIIHLLTTKLDFATKREWEKRLLSKREKSNLIEQKTTVKDMITFLENHCKYLHRVATEKPESDNINNQKKPCPKTGNSKFARRLTSHAATKKVCPLCQESHTLYACGKLRALPVESRIDEVRKLHYCFNCLTPGHRNLQCYAAPCNKCHRKHNSLLHLDNNYKPKEKSGNNSEKESVANSEPASYESKKAVCVANINQTNNEHVILGTAMVWAKDIHGKYHECRALIDSCSQVHLMTYELCQRLSLPMSKSETVVSGVFKSSQEAKYCTNISIVSKYNDFSKELNCLITPEITDNMPNIVLHRGDFEIPKELLLADPLFTETRPVDLLIGGGLFWNLMCVNEKQYQLRSDQPILQKTKLGWIVAGPMQLPSHQSRTVCNLITNQQLHNQVERFWEIENHSIKQMSPELNPLDDLEQHFLSTTGRDKDGRFIVTIPLKDEVNDLGESYTRAHKCLLALERKLSKQPEFKKAYSEFMEDYKNQGHMVLIPDEEIKTDKVVNYLPHHAVMKEGSTTTKVRGVYNGSLPTSSGLSLNQVQRVGPIVQNDLISIVLRFRQHPIVISADIAQMYRQIKINKYQQDLQRILWRADPSLPIRHYRLTTVPYGTASAPYLATRALRQIGEENKESYPVASEVITRDFYVDDLLTGTSTVEEAQKLKDEITKLLAASGMELRKWASNEPRVFNDKNHSTSERMIQSDKDPKTLGLFWKPEADELQYLVKEHEQQKITKRSILSITSKIFDPFGLVGPVIIRAKIMLQKLWELQLNWDEALPQELQTLWTEFSSKLNALNEISVPRFVLCENPVSIELHGFCDASEAAYGACIYIRSIHESGQITIRLLCGKSRVAPLKKISVPRLELQAALLLSQLTKTVTSALDLKFEENYFWSDSTITLCWIKSPPSRWKTFVANRTSEIQELTGNNWNHVISEENPADLISRGTDPERLRDQNLWWKGPDWLSLPTENWTSHQKAYHVDTEPVLEERKCEHVFIVTSTNDFNLLERYSSLNKLVRITAYCLRFIEVLKKNVKCRLVIHKKVERSMIVDCPSAKERSRAMNCLLKFAQARDFPCELKNITESKQVSSKSKLATLNPFIDPAGLLRVGGQLINAPIAFEQKHPAILAPGNPLTLLIIAHEHIKLLHAGCQAVMSSLRTRYWPLSCKNTVKKVIKKCVKFFRAQPISPEYIMGNLPSDRVAPNRPFLTCGVDYASPFLVIEKSRSRAVSKAYICIFVCFATKAVHIELARDMSTNAFFNCLYRFVSRQGKCKNIHSDNGTNFVGARNELKELGQFLQNREFQEAVTDLLANEQVTWHMIPPNAPNFGGLWKSAVKSAKKHLKIVIGETRLTFEELYTLLTQVEACLNSRPLSPISNDPNDIIPLTPGHFLIGDSLAAIPQHDLREIRQNRLNRYQHIQFMLQHFWQRWQKEYLSQLQQRHKGANSSDTHIEPGAMVIIRDDNLPPQKWKMGRIDNVHPGNDGVTRVVSIKVAGSSIIKRPLSKICMLPIETELIKLPE